MKNLFPLLFHVTIFLRFKIFIWDCKTSFLQVLSFYISKQSFYYFKLFIMRISRNSANISCCIKIRKRRKYKSFFFLRFLFAWVNFSFCILMISSWFKTKARFEFCHKLLLKLQKFRRKRNQNTWSLVFPFLIFPNFLKFRNRFWYQHKKTFLINCQYFSVTLLSR